MSAPAPETMAKVAEFSMEPWAIKKRMETLITEWEKTARFKEKQARRDLRSHSDSAVSMRLRIADLRELFELAGMR